VGPLSGVVVVPPVVVFEGEEYKQSEEVPGWIVYRSPVYDDEPNGKTRARHKNQSCFLWIESAPTFRVRDVKEDRVSSGVVDGPRVGGGGQVVEFQATFKFRTPLSK
jgi:hypothetical protein